MNQNNPQPEDMERELRQLELATQRQLPAGTRLDAETASLREGFLALGQLLDAAAEPVTPARVLPRSLWTSVPFLGVIGAVAASLVVGAVAWQLWQPAKNGPAPNPANIARDKVETPAPKVEEPKQPTVVAKSPVEKAPSPDTVLPPEVVTDDESSELAWNDSLDDAISNVHERVWTMRQNSFRGDGVYTSFSGSLEKIGQELESDSL